MPGTPAQTARITARAAARIRLARALRLGGRGLLIGSIAAVVLVLLARWWPLREPLSFVLPIAGLMIPFVGGVVLGALKRVSLAEAAGVLDETHHLKDRLTSAIELADRDGVFAALVIEEAEQAALHVRADRAVPLRPGRAWLVGLAGVVVAGGLWTAVPPREIRRARTVAMDTPEQRAEAAERIERTIEQLGPAAEQSDLSDDLQRTIEQLHRGELDAESALAAAADEIEQAAAEAETSAAASAEAERAIADAADRAARESTDDAVRALAEALSRGDLDGARRAADQIRRQDETMPPEARETMARELEELARLLDENRPEPTGSTPPIEELDADTPVDRADEDRIAEELEKKGLDPAEAEDLARRMAEAARQRREMERSAEDVEALKRALEQTARDMRTPEDAEPDRPPSGGEEQADAEQRETRDDRAERDGDRSAQKEDGQGKESRDSRRGEKPGSPGAPSPAAPTENRGSGDRTSGQQSAERGKEKGNTSGHESRGEKKDDNAAEPRGDRDGSGRQPSDRDQGGQQPGGQPQRGPKDESRSGSDGKQIGRQDTVKNGEKTGEKSGEKSGSDQSEKNGDRVEQDRPGTAGGNPDDGAPQSGRPGGKADQPTDQEGENHGQPEGGGAGGGGDDAGGDPLGRALDRLERRRAERAMNEKRAREMRRRAQELLDKATPEQRERLEKIARRLAERQSVTRGPSAPYEAEREIVDARGKGPRDDRGQVLAEWYNPEGEPAEGIERGATADRLREAVASAERAVEQQRVPSRYRKLVRDVFEQIKARAEKEHTGAAPLSEDAETKGGEGG